MKSLNEHLNEVLRLQGDEVVWDPSHKGIINKFGKTKKFEPYLVNPWINDSTRLPVYTMFQGGDDLIDVQIMKAIKGRSDQYKLSDDAYLNNIRRASIYMNSIIAKIKPDVIVAPKSKAPFNSDILTIYKQMNPTVLIIDDFLIKNPNLDDITFEPTVKAKFDAKTISNQYKNIEKAKRVGAFSASDIDPKFRIYYRNWLKINGNPNAIKGKNVVIFDDFFTSGATLIESANILYENGASNVSAITFLKKK